MEKLKKEGQQPTSYLGKTIEEALNSDEEAEVLWAVRTMLSEVVEKALTVMAEKFDPMQCADLVSWAAKDYTSQFGKNMVKGAVRNYQEKQLKAKHDFGTWSDLPTSQQDQS